MKARVCFFGATASAAGVREDVIDIPDGSNAREALREVVNAFPGLERWTEPGSLILAVNQEYTSSSTLLSEGDELAVFTAVSGG